MRKTNYEEVARKEKRYREFFEEQMQHNSKIQNFEETSINMLILEILTKLTGKDLENEKYTDNMLFEHIHQHIEDLGILYNIRKELKGSNKSTNRDD